MMRRLSILLLSLNVVLLTVSASHALEYKAINISRDPHIDSSPKINNNGCIVWLKEGILGYGIHLCNGSTVTNLSNNACADSAPQINDNGDVVWSGYDGTDREIFLYDGSTVINISNRPGADYDPQINDNSSVVWSGYDGTDREIFLYDGSAVTQLTDDVYDNRYPQINENDYVVWQGRQVQSLTWQCFLYDGTNIISTNPEHDCVHPQINNNGNVVWSGYDGTDREIFLYDGSTVTNISNRLGADYHPQINDNGNVVWSGGDSSGTISDIFVYNGSYVTNISSVYTFLNEEAQIDARGNVVWSGYDGWDYEIFFYDGLTVTQLTINAYNEHCPHINDKGYVIWFGDREFGNKEIFLAITSFKCSLQPQANVIPREGTLGLHVSISNNMSDTETVLFATNVTLPNGSVYPTSGFLDGPFNILLTPYGSRYRYISHTIPDTAPFGTYTYHGYVGLPETGVIAECLFDFAVPQSCFQSSECADNELCRKAVGNCHGSGQCVLRPPESRCRSMYYPVCGCDGLTYANTCWAELAGVSVAYEGECVP